MEDRRANERKEMKSMREALRAMREEARRHEKITIDLSKKHEEEMQKVMDLKNIESRWERFIAMDEVLESQEDYSCR